MLKDGIFPKEKKITGRAKDPSSAHIFACLKPIKQVKCSVLRKTQKISLFIKLLSTKNYIFTH